MTGLRRRSLGSFLGVAVGLAVALAIVGLVEPFGNDDPSGGLANGGRAREAATAPTTAGQGNAAVMSLHDTPRAIPELRFRDGDGRALSLADFRGKVVLLNIWATWCGPCREEMPTLDRLQAELGGPDFEVVALSIDRAGIGVVTGFYDEVGIEHIAKYIDESGKAAQQLNAVGLPTTLLLDRDGREIARHVGPAEWDTWEMMGFFRRQLGRQSGALPPGPPRERAHRQADGRAVLSAPYQPLRPARLPVTGSTAPSAITRGNTS